MNIFARQSFCFNIRGGNKTKESEVECLRDKKEKYPVGEYGNRPIKNNLSRLERTK